MDRPTGNRGYADILPTLGDPTWIMGGDRRVGISAFFGRRCRIDRANDRKAESAAVLPFLVSPIYSVPGFDDWSDRIPPDRKPLADFCNEL
jgi:hypothetical protein